MKKASKLSSSQSAPPAERRILNDGVEDVGVTLLRPHPRNARQGDVGAVYESIRVNGFFGHLLVQRSTNYILAGNHRYLAALQLGFERLPVLWVDVDDEQALRILLADNRTSDLASYDNTRLAELLAELENQSDLKLDGTGYDADDLDDLIEQMARVAIPPDEDGKKPKGEDRLAIVVFCHDQGEQETVHELLAGEGYAPRKTILNERTQLAVG